MFKSQINSKTDPDQISVANTPYLSQTKNAELVFPELNFLWDTDSIKQFPYQSIVLIGLLLMLVASMLFRVIKCDMSRKVSKVFQYRFLSLTLILLFAILHTGLLSPYTTNYFYSRALDLQNRWYTVFLLGNNQGAVNADYFVFRSLDHIYWGPLFEGLAGDGQLIRRSILNFLLSTPNYFINSYFTWLAFNVLLLGLTTLHVQKVLSKHVNPISANLTSILFGTSLPVLLYFGSPWTYLGGVCTSVLLVFTFIDRIILNSNRSNYQDTFVGALAIFASLTYDLIPLLLALLVYSLFVYRSKVVLLGLLAAIAAPSLLSKMYLSLGGSSSGNNSRYIGEAIERIFQLISKNEFGTLSSKIFDGILELPSTYLYVIGAPIIFMAAVGLFHCKQSAIRVLTFTILLISIATKMFFSVSSSELALYPRIYFHPLGILIFLAGYGLNKITLRGQGKSIIKHPFRFTGHLTALVAIAFALYIGNADLFGRPDFILGIQFGSSDTSGINWIDSDLSWRGDIVFDE